MLDLIEEYRFILWIVYITAPILGVMLFFMYAKKTRNTYRCSKCSEVITVEQSDVVRCSSCGALAELIK